MKPILLTLSLLLTSTLLFQAHAQEIRPNEAGKICMEGNRLYVVLPLHGFSIYDISNTRAPKEIRFVKLPGIVDIATRGEFVFANQYQDLVLIKVPLDQAQPIREIKRRNNVFPSRRETQIATLATFANFSEYKEDVLDNPTLSPAPATSVNGSMSCVALVGDYIYAVEGQELKTFNAKPTSQELFSNTNTMPLRENALETIWTDGENRLYLGSQTGLHIVDITSRAEPKLLGSYRHKRSCDPVVVFRNIAYSTLRDGNECPGGENKLELVDISNPAQPRFIQHYRLTNPHGLAVQNDMVIVCDGRDGLKIFDIANPSNLQQIAHTSGLTTYDVLFDADKKAAFVSVPKELHIFSLEQKNNPVRQSVIVLPSMDN